MAADDIARLGLHVDSTGVVRASKNLRNLEKQSGRNEQKNATLKRSFIGLKTVVSAVAGAMVLKHFISTASAFETMKISLETVTGSAEKAQTAFDGIKDFAKSTPFSVEEVTQSFIKLKALGIDPTERNLKSFGNTSSAMGKSLNQMIEAVADAATGEFERLKEFGIKASKQGDRATFVFKGVATEIGNNSREITEYLQNIGETNFGGAMEKQMDTANGAFSNFGDAVDNLSDKLGEAGLTEIVKNVVLWFTSLVDTIADFVDGDSPLDKLTTSLAKANRELERAKDGSQYQAIMQAAVKRYQAEIDGINKVNEAKKNSIDSAGAEGVKTKSAEEVEIERQKNVTLTAMSESFIEAEAQRRIESLERYREDENEAVMMQEAAQAQHAYEVEQIATAAKEADSVRRVESLQRTLGLMSTLTSSSNKKAFKIGKTAAKASTIVSTYDAMQLARTAAPPPFNAILMAAEFAVGTNNLSRINAQQFSGQAHDGMDYVRRSGSYNLEQGEMVVDKGTSNKVREGLTGGGGTVINFSPVIQAFDADDVLENKEGLFNTMYNMLMVKFNEEGLRLT